MGRLVWTDASGSCKRALKAVGPSRRPAEQRQLGHDAFATSWSGHKGGLHQGVYALNTLDKHLQLTISRNASKEAASTPAGGNRKLLGRCELAQGFDHIQTVRRANLRVLLPK